MGFIIENVRMIRDLNDEERKIYINGIELAPTSTDLEYQFSDLYNDESVRGYLGGYINLNLIRPDVLNINNVAWNMIDPGYAEYLFKLVKPKVVNGKFQYLNVDVYDRTQGCRVTKKMYASADRQYSETRTVQGWAGNVSFSLIER